MGLDQALNLRGVKYHQPQKGTQLRTINARRTIKNVARGKGGKDSRFN